MSAAPIDRPTEDVEPRTAAAIEFLQKWRPGGPWVLTAISTDRKSIDTATFEADATAELIAWIDEHNGTRNLYFHVNPCLRPMLKKAQREDIASLDWLHVDIDPRAGEDVEQERALNLLTDELPEGIPRPTCIIFSGGGYQAFWKLEEPQPIDGQLEKAEDLKRYNQQLEILFGGDNCHNVDRIMRLPGTMNIPDAKKRKKGRTKVEARLVQFNDTTYPLSAFTPATLRQTRVGSYGEQEVKVSGNVARLAGVDDLDDWKGVEDRVKVIIVQGHHPDETKEGDNSRSAWLFDVCCNLVRADVPDEVIYSVITDPDFGISESVIDKGSNAEKYALRQISRAHEVEAEFEIRNGVPVNSLRNVRLAISRLGVQLSYNEFTQRKCIAGLHEGYGEQLTDDAVNRVRLSIEERFDFRPPKDFFFDVVGDLARGAPFHPVRDYLDGLRWDGKQRVDEWLATYGGASSTDYSLAVGRIFLVAAVRRIRNPGCKFDEMLVLESPQGMDKSSALRILAVRDDWFSDDLPLGADGKRVVEQTSGKWIVEAAELTGLTDRRLQHLKAMLSRQKDRARLAYRRLEDDYPRHFVIVGTTNDRSYLIDHTGNRRFWPVGVKRFDLAGLRRDRDQLWAEAAAMEQRGESIRLPAELWPAAAGEQAEREVDDPWCDVIEHEVGTGPGKVLPASVWELLEVPKERRSQAYNKRLGDVMRHLGFERKKLRHRGKVRWHYVRGDGALAWLVDPGDRGDCF